MKFPKRNLESIIKSICKKNNIKYDLIGQGFIFKLTKKNKTQFVYGYNFPCNNVCASKICDDKAATSEILKKNKISTFEHTFYMRGFFTKEEILKTFKKFNNNVVVKPNNGTGGKNVIHCVTFPSLLKAIDTILNSGINFSISPFYDYEHEYRIIVYKKKNMIFYCKNRVDDWRHNLALGADIDENIESNIKTKLNNIVKKVNEIIPINFFSIDIAKIKNDFKVVEINSGVMMERYSTFNYQKAYNVYEKVIIDLFK